MMVLADWMTGASNGHAGDASRSVLSQPLNGSVEDIPLLCQAIDQIGIGETISIILESEA
jgi:hypothetical protein